MKSQSPTYIYRYLKVVSAICEKICKMVNATTRFSHNFLNFHALFENIHTAILNTLNNNEAQKPNLSSRSTSRRFPDSVKDKMACEN